MIITLQGVPSGKKNALRPGRKGQKMHYDRGLRRALDACVLQAQSQWQGREPLTHPIIAMHCWGYPEQTDRDGLFVNALDVLVKAGILRDDSIRHSNGWYQIAPANLGGEPRVVLHIGKGNE